MSNYIATTEGKTVRVTESRSGTVKVKFNAGDGITHAIANESTVNVFYRKGGVKVYTINGSFVSMTGDCR